MKIHSINNLHIIEKEGQKLPFKVQSIKGMRSFKTLDAAVTALEAQLKERIAMQKVVNQLLNNKLGADK